MATTTGRGQCFTCRKEKLRYPCEGCSQLFCTKCLPRHRQELSQELHQIEVNRDEFREALTEQITNPEKHSLIKQINQWENDSIRNIQQTANKCRNIVFQHTTEHFNKIEISLTKLTDQLRLTRQDDYNEIHLRELKQKLTKLAEKLDKPSNISIKQNSTSLINEISVVVFRKCIHYS